MGKRGKRNRLKRKEVHTEPANDGHCDDNGTNNDGQNNDGAASGVTASESIVVTCRGIDTNNANDASLRPPPPFTESDLFDEDGRAATLRTVWAVLENRGKKIHDHDGHRWNPTPIQLQTWSVLLQTNLDVIGIAPTGSGKTYAYALPLLSQIDDKDSGIQGIILVPTRELALQVEKDLKRTKLKRITIVAVYGGVDRDHQLTVLSSNDAPVVIAATPGRLGDLIQDDQVKDKLTGLKWLVMDEADRLAIQVDMANQVDQIMHTLGKEGMTRRTCLFSATFPEAASKWNDWINETHVLIKVNTVTLGQSQPEAIGDSVQQEETKPAVESSSRSDEEQHEDQVDGHINKKHRGPLDFGRIRDNVTQTLHVCSAHKKPRKLMTTLQKIRPDKSNRTQSLCLVFFARIKTLQYVSKLLQKDGFACSELHGHMNQKDRERVLANFQCGKVQTLLATDVAARGIHVPNVDSVINYDFPISLEQYVHRCGRAGRSGNKPATVYSFFTRELQPMAKDVVALLTESKAWIDPNLVALAGEKPQEGKRTKKRKRDETATKTNVDGEENDDYDDNEDPFPFLNPNRIVLKRASHVSDASSSSSEEDEE